MKYGFIMPFGDARSIANHAREAEQAGWDGYFMGEAVWHIDVWVALSAAAMLTERIRLGTMIAQLPRTKPWKLASETATLDNLSNGRVILAVGVGVNFYGYQAFLDETTDNKVRAELMDEGIDLLTLLYQGEPFTFNGRHYHVDLTRLDPQYYPPRPVQQPRIPIWVVGIWPRMKSMRRVLRCDGLIPIVMNTERQYTTILPEHVREMREYVAVNRTLPTPFDVTSEGQTVGMSQAQMADVILPWAEAGATWWLETLYGQSEETIITRLRQGPPQIS